MFSATQRSPQSIRNARVQISKQNPEAWNALLRSFLEEQFVTAGKEFSTTNGVTNQGAKFAMRVMGTKKQQDMMKAAMTDSQFAVFSDLVEVLKATGRTAATNSDTAFKQETIQGMKRQGAGAFVQGTRMASRPLNSMNEWAESTALAATAENLATKFTQPGAVNKLKQLRELPPNSLRAMVVAGQFLGVGGDALMDSGASVASVQPNPLTGQLLGL